MNILILNWRDPQHPLAGGAEQMVMEHAKYWVKKGENVVWFSSGFRGGKKEENVEGIKIIRRGNHYTVSFWAFIYYLRKKFNDIELVVDCFHFVPYFSRFYMLGKKKIAIIQEVAGNLWFENLPLPLAYFGYIFEPLVLRLYKRIPFITGSNSAKQDLLKLGFSAKKVHVVNHGINRYKVASYEKVKRPVMLFLGRISRDKGIEDALMMLGLLVRDNKDVELWVVGRSESKEYEKKVKKLMRQFEVDNNCRWFGFVSNEEKFSLLSKAWIMIHPSRKEGWGLNVIEANSVGTPAVGYAVAGLSDSIVHNKTGLLVEPDALSLADGVEALINDRVRLKKLSKNAKEWSKQFTWSASAKESYRIISSVMKKS